jgi:hypothetical protein
VRRARARRHVPAAQLAPGDRMRVCAGVDNAQPTTTLAPRAQQARDELVCVTVPRGARAQLQPRDRSVSVQNTHVLLFKAKLTLYTVRYAHFSFFFAYWEWE